LRRLDISAAVKGERWRQTTGPLREFQACLRACPHLEDLNVAGFTELTFAGAPDVEAALARSLKRLDVRNCTTLIPALPNILGRGLQVLKAGWLWESDKLDWDAWTSMFPRHLFRQICRKSPNLTVLRFPGYALYNGQPEHRMRPLLEDYAEISGVGGLRELRRVDFCCAQLLDDPVVVSIARGCSRLRNLGLRACDNVSDIGLLAVAEHLAGTLVHINISCCYFKEASVRKLVYRCRGLRSLDLCYCKGLNSSLINYLCSDTALCPALEMVGAGGLDLGDAEVAALCKKYGEGLVDLGVGSAARLTDRGLENLAKLPRLRKLSAHQLRGVSADGLRDFCQKAPSIKAVDADGCEYTPAPVPAVLRALELCLSELPYDYSVSDGEENSDDEAEKRKKRERERSRREREAKDRARRERERERREREAAERERQEKERQNAAGLDFLAAMTKAVDSIPSDGVSESQQFQRLQPGPEVPQAAEARPCEDDRRPHHESAEAGAPAATWVVVGGGGFGIVVRENKGRKARELGLLKTGARIQEIEETDGRLHYRKLTSEGPDEGWVSLEAKGKPLVVRE